MNESYSNQAKQTSKAKHELRKISKLMGRRASAVKAGDDDTAMKYSNKLHNYSTEGGERNPKVKAVFEAKGLFGALKKMIKPKPLTQAQKDSIAQAEDEADMAPFRRAKANQARNSEMSDKPSQSVPRGKR